MREIERRAVSPQVADGSELLGVSTITIRTLAACLSELLKLEQAQSHREYCPDLCQLLDCPQEPILRLAVCDAIRVLEETKGRFKSKELKELRESLQDLLENSRKYATPGQSCSMLER